VGSAADREIRAGVEAVKGRIVAPFRAHHSEIAVI
jgi:hypothetical protein